jgi:hypothetical protein
MTVRTMVLFAIFTLSTILGGCGAGLSRPGPTLHTSRADGDSTQTMADVCNGATLRQRLGSTGVRTPAGTFYCGTSY